MLAILAAFLIAAGPSDPPSGPNSSSAPLTTVAPVPAVPPLERNTPDTGGPVPERIERGSTAGPVNATPFSAGPNTAPSAGPTTGTRTSPPGGALTPSLSR